MIKIKLKELLKEWKKVIVQTVLALNYNKANGAKVFYSCSKLTASNSDIEKALIFMHQSIILKIENYACEDWLS